MTLEEVRDTAMRGLTNSGISEENATVIADVMTTAERDGCKSHGLFRMPGYCASSRSGRVDGKVTPTLHDDAPGVIRVDGHHGFTAPAMAAGRPALVEKARSQGIAAMPILNAWLRTGLLPSPSLIPAPSWRIRGAFVSSTARILWLSVGLVRANRQ